MTQKQNFSSQFIHQKQLICRSTRIFIQISKHFDIVQSAFPTNKTITKSEKNFLFRYLKLHIFPRKVVAYASFGSPDLELVPRVIQLLTKLFNKLAPFLPFSLELLGLMGSN